MYADIFVKIYVDIFVGNVRQIIVTNVRSGSLTRPHTHHKTNQTPLIALAL